MSGKTDSRFVITTTAPSGGKWFFWRCIMVGLMAFIMRLDYYFSSNVEAQAESMARTVLVVVVGSAILWWTRKRSLHTQSGQVIVTKDGVTIEEGETLHLLFSSVTQFSADGDYATIETTRGTEMLRLQDTEAFVAEANQRLFEYRASRAYR